MDIDPDAWRPRHGEHALIEGSGRRGDFLSVQTVTEADADVVRTTGGWCFERRDGAWRTETSVDIVLKPTPNLNTHLAYPVKAIAA